MNLQDILMKLSAYSVGCRIINGNFMINITYDEGWKVIPPENEKIEFEQRGNITYYAASINEVSFDDVFESIKETIDYNIDLQRKVTLYKAKVDELQEIFANESLDKLRTITFIFDEKKKPKRKYVRKNKKQDDLNVKIDNVDEQSEVTETDIHRNEEKVEKPKVNIEEQENVNADEINYNEYDGEAIEDEEENKVDYLEQLRNQ